MWIWLLSAVACRPQPPPSGLADSRLLAFRSTDGVHYTQDAELAQGFDSLGLHLDGDAVVLTGLDHSRKIPWFERYQAPAVSTLRQSEGGWLAERVAFPGLSAPALIDPQWDAGGLWHISRQGLGDPALEGSNQVFHGETLVMEGPGLADPMGIHFAGEDMLATTVWGQGVVLWGGAPPQQRSVWPALTVPFLREESGMLALYAVGVVQGRRLPVVLRSPDGQRFTEPVALALDPLPTSCTSPVVAGGGQDWWLFCVEEAARPPGPAPGSPQVD